MGEKVMVIYCNILGVWDTVTLWTFSLFKLLATLMFCEHHCYTTCSRFSCVIQQPVCLLTASIEIMK